MKKQYVIVEHRNSAAFLRQRDQIAQLQKSVADLKRQLRDVERKYHDEIYFNTCLTDLLRDNNIPYRDVFDFKFRVKAFQD